MNLPQTSTHSRTSPSKAERAPKPTVLEEPKVTSVKFSEAFMDPDCVGSVNYSLLVDRAAQVAKAGPGISGMIDFEHVLTVKDIDKLIDTFQEVASTAVTITGQLQELRKKADAYERTLIGKN